MINLLIIDPHTVVRYGFETFLSDYDYINVAHTVPTLKIGIDYIESNPADIVISEMILNDESPIDLINRVKKIDPEINVIFFTTQDREIYSIPLMQAGAIGFLSKNVEASVMADAIKKIKSNKLYITNNFNNEMNLDLDIDRPRNNYGILSFREIEVLKYLTEGKRNIEIAECLKSIKKQSIPTKKG